MAVETSAALEPIRLAVALAHCLPDCRVELTDASGATVLVGFQPDAEIAPCLACRAVASAMRTSPRDLGPMLGLCAGCPRARVLDEEIGESHVGLGVYRYRNDETWGFVFTTLAPTQTARAIILQASTDLLLGTAAEAHLVEAGAWQLINDDELHVRVCASRYTLEDGGLVDDAERLALAIAGRCLIEELAESR